MIRADGKHTASGDADWASGPSVTFQRERHTTRPAGLWPEREPTSPLCYAAAVHVELIWDSTDDFSRSLKRCSLADLLARTICRGTRPPNRGLPRGKPFAVCWRKDPREEITSPQSVTWSRAPTGQSIQIWLKSFPLQNSLEKNQTKQNLYPTFAISILLWPFNLFPLCSCLALILNSPL